MIFPKLPLRTESGFAIVNVRFPIAGADYSDEARRDVCNIGITCAVFASL